MYGKRRNLRKRGSLGAAMGFSLVFSLISIIYIFFSVLTYATANDYLFYNLQNLTEEMEADGIVKNGTSAITQNWGDDYTNLNLYLDDLWLIAYIVFITTSLAVAYRADRQNYFSFLGILFYGIMVLLFVLTIFHTLTEWFKVELLDKIVPTAYIIVPKFYFYLDNIGVFSAIHLVACVVANMLDFDFARIRQRKRQEQQALDDDEVV